VVSAGGILLSAGAAAAVVVCGGLYALLLALGRLHGSVLLARASLVAYGLLVVSTFVLADALGLSGAWLAVIAVMLVGYLLAPSAIWHLTAATHAAGHGKDGATATEDRSA